MSSPRGSPPREARHLVPLEVLAVLAIAIAPLPEPLPAALPLLVVASLARWVRGRSWGEVVGGAQPRGIDERSESRGWGPRGLSPRGGAQPRGIERAGVGAIAGALALGFAVLAGTPVLELVSFRAVEWSAHPIVRGNASLFATMALYVAATAVATELALRGWIVERVLELSPGPPILPVLVGAFAEALITPGDVAARLGAAMFGAGLGWMYAAGGRSLLAPVCARLVFELGVLFLEAMRLVG